jgi:cell division protein FtsI (penicillin-binding protein 3)/stage V sporulation protein D (sporulation-specific penicillin-binding protein)
MKLKTRHRAGIVCALVGLVFTGFSCRLVYLQVTKHEEYSRIAAAKHSIRQPINARRGLIKDRTGEILAANVPVRKVVLDGSHVNNAPELARVAAPFLGMEPEALEKELVTDKKYVVIKHDLAEEKALELRKILVAKSLRGLSFQESTTRLYPNGAMLSHVLGFLGRKNPKDENLLGVEGVERSFEDHLRGEDGFRHIERDRTGREIVVYRGQEQGPRHGHSIELTIDMGLQSIVEAELESACAELKPAMAVAVLADPKTGEILAMANRPSFDPNQMDEIQPEAMKNRAIMDVVEPGSTFKIVVSAGALNERVVNQKTQIFCENGRFFYGGRTLKDHHGYGSMSVRDIIVKSSNIGCAKMALMMGEDKFYEYVRGFGFGERSGIDLPGEVPGLLSPPHRWDKLTITRMPMGHSIAVTPLQMTMAMSVIANGGRLMKPRIVKTIRDADGNEVQKFEPEVVRQVVPEDTARFVSAALAGVTGVGGTAKLANVPGFDVAGKTGTAQKVDPKGGYTPGKYVVSFVGYMPVEDPAFVCLVMVDDAKIPPGLNYGGLVAAPIFARIGEKAARYMNLVPSLRADAVLPVAMNQGPSEDEEVRR